MGKAPDLEEAAKAVEEFLKAAKESAAVLTSKEVSGEKGSPLADLGKKVATLTDKFETAAKKAKLGQQGKDGKGDPKEAAKQIDALLVVLREFGEVEKKLKRVLNTEAAKNRDVKRAIERLLNAIKPCDDTLSEVQRDLEDAR